MTPYPLEATFGPLGMCPPPLVFTRSIFSGGQFWTRHNRKNEVFWALVRGKRSKTGHFGGPKMCQNPEHD